MKKQPLDYLANLQKVNNSLRLQSKAFSLGLD